MRARLVVEGARIDLGGSYVPVEGMSTKELKRGYRDVLKAICDGERILGEGLLSDLNLEYVIDFLGVLEVEKARFERVMSQRGICFEETQQLG